MKPPRPSTFTMTAPKAAYLEEAEAFVVDAYDRVAADARERVAAQPTTPLPFRVCGHDGCKRFIFAEQLFCSKGHAR